MRAWIGIVIVVLYCLFLVIELARTINGHKWRRTSAMLQEAVRSMNARIEELVRDNDMEGLGRFLSQIHVRHEHPVVLVASLRITFAHRHQIPQWRIVRNNIARELQQRGHDPNRLLAGLFP